MPHYNNHYDSSCAAQKEFMSFMRSGKYNRACELLDSHPKIIELLPLDRIGIYYSQLRTNSMSGAAEKLMNDAISIVEKKPGSSSGCGIEEIISSSLRLSISGQEDRNYQFLTSLKAGDYKSCFFIFRKDSSILCSMPLGAFAAAIHGIKQEVGFSEGKLFYDKGLSILLFMKQISEEKDSAPIYWEGPLSKSREKKWDNSKR